MVMHARKLPRLDGYFDRNQAHPYENTSKYSSKAGFSDRYNDKMRESPTSGNGGSYGRNDSPDSRHSPRYHNKSTYSQRLKERERERHDTASTKSPSHKGVKSSSSSSSSSSNSKDHQVSSSSTSRKSGESSTTAAHRSNHDRTHPEDKEKEKRPQVGDWSEHISSSGKKYYYNCKTEVSQWEKPKEWIEWEKQQGVYRLPHESSRSKDRSHDRQSSVSGSKSDKHSSSGTDRNLHLHHQSSRSHSERHAQQTSFTPGKVVNSSRTVDHSHHGSSSSTSSASGQYKGDEHHLRSESRTSGERTERRTDARKCSEDSQTQDMDISPESCDTPSSSQTDSYPQSRIQTPVSSSTQPQSHMPSPSIPQLVQPQSLLQPSSHSQPQSHLLSPSQVTLANLPKLISQMAGTKGLPNLAELSPQEALRTVQQALQLTKQVTSLAQTGGVNRSPMISLTPSDSHSQKSLSPLLSQGHSSHSSHPQTPHSTSTPHHNSHSQSLPTNHGHTPPSCHGHTAVSNYHLQHQHQSHLPVDGKTELDRGRISPASDYSTHSSRRGSPTSSISSLHSLSGTGTSSLATAVLKPSLPSLTPSLANYYCEDLISHVTGWQADHAERQASRYSEEAHNIGSLNCTQVSAELKMARSLVRLAEIQATLQEQKILFLRQQIKELEDWRSQNTFMSDS